jgi:hypothetical protein
VITIIVAAALLFVFLIEPQLKLASVVGTYTKIDNSSSLQINSDGTVFVQMPEDSLFGTWKPVNDNIIQVSFTVSGTPMTEQYNFNGNQLVSTSNSNDVLTKSSTNINPIVTQTPEQ